MQTSFLPQKFNSYILNFLDADPTKQDLKKNLDEIFSKESGFTTLGDKDHIREHADLPGWIIKGDRKDRFESPDSNIYRVRKAAKIEKILKENECVDCKVPKKYLYKGNDEKWYVIAEKIPLSKKMLEDSLLDNIKATPLSPSQAKAITLAIYDADFTDVHKGNFGYDEKGNLIFFDTEPVIRNLKKASYKNESYLDKIQRALYLHLMHERASETAYLFFSMSNQAKNVVRAIQDQRHSQFRNKLIFQIALSVIVTVGLLISASSLKNRLAVVSLRIAASVVGLVGCERIYELVTLLWKHRYFRSHLGHCEMMMERQ